MHKEDIQKPEKRKILKERRDINEEVCIAHDKGYNLGLQTERDYRNWLIDNAPIEDVLPNPTGDDTLIFDTAKAIRQMFKEEK